MRPTSAGAIACGWLVALSSIAIPAEVVYEWQLPAGLPGPPVPNDNPMSAAKVELGRYLFYDTRLSGNGTQSCASCHRQEAAFTDGRARSVGSTGEEHPRSSMSLVNVAYAQALTWGDPQTSRLEDQALVPMYGDHPIELGLDGDDRWLGAIERDPTYQRLFPAAFGEADSRPTAVNVVKAIAAFERTIVSLRSPYDRYHFDRDDSAVSESAKRGEVLFHSRPLSCFTCHGGVFFSDSMGPASRIAPPFHNTGLYNLASGLSYPLPNTGIHQTTGRAEDVGRFKTPTLRNIALTAPYMHDGSVATLDDVIDHYSAGGRTIAIGPNSGIGRANPNKHPAIRGFEITQAQRADLIAFLESLTDTALISDARFSNPWPPAGRDTMGDRRRE